jgi:DNA-nicking Smr family endonuclease
MEARLDLHGLHQPAARRAVHDSVARLWEGGGRCLLVIHGRGRDSEAGPVLKDALLEWLAEPPSGARVMAFSSARGRDGGVGATYVLLRRDR